MNRLINAVKKYNYELSKKQINYFELYINSILKYNTKVNLTSHKDFDSVLIRLIIDSIIPIFELKTRNIINLSNKRIIDLGTGAGIPGIPIKIIFNNLNISLSESKRKKIVFLEEIITKLNLNIDEIINPSNTKIIKKFDGVITKAFGNINKIMFEAKKYMKSGLIIAYKGKYDKIVNELNDVKDKKINTEILKMDIPFLEEERHLVLIKLN